MKYDKSFLRIFSATFLSGLLFSCASVKEYQKAHLNDQEMQLNNRKVEIFEADFQSYREGAVGGTIGNSGSGCGCN